MRRPFLHVFLFLLPLAGCFNFDEPICAYACSPSTSGSAGTSCPDDYECRADGYCHKQGTTEACSFSDAAITPDLSANQDMTMGPDLEDSDSGNPDSGDTDL